MITRIARWAFVIGLFPNALAAQSTDRSFANDVLVPTLTGGMAGLGLAVAYIRPPGGSWLAPNEAALPLAVATGIGVAFLVRGTSKSFEPTAARRPRLWAGVGAGGASDWDYAVGYRTPISERLTLDAAVVIVNDTGEKIETETRCSGGLAPFCTTGDFITDYRYQQSVTTMVRAMYSLRPASGWNPALVFGGGPSAVHVAAAERPESTHTGLLLTGALTVERGRRSRLLAETGFRVTPLLGGEDASIGKGAWFLRIGLGFGHVGRD